MEFLHLLWDSKDQLHFYQISRSILKNYLSEKLLKIKNFVKISYSIRKIQVETDAENLRLGLNILWNSQFCHQNCETWSI